MSARMWPQRLSAYRRASAARSAYELCLTLFLFVAAWLAMLLATSISLWLALPLAIPAAGFLVRLFMIQHDCSHDAFFNRRAANAWTGRLIGILTLTPFDQWRHTHAIHHASSGNLGRRGVGDVETLTVAEYAQRSRLGRLRYRLYRHPLVMFGIGPAYLFLLQHRVPVGVRGWQIWSATMATNIAIALCAALIVLLAGIQTLVFVHLPIALIAASIGVWLFYVQHQFEHTSWDLPDDWEHPDAALNGSSHYALPGPLRWFTANIGVHHVHHLCSRIPFYRLPEVLRDYPELAETGRLTLWQSLGCVRLVLWDQVSRKLVTFGEAARLQAPAAAPRTKAR